MDEEEQNYVDFKCPSCKVGQLRVFIGTYERKYRGCEGAYGISCHHCSEEFFDDDTYQGSDSLIFVENPDEECEEKTTRNILTRKFVNLSDMFSSYIRFMSREFNKKSSDKSNENSI